METRNKLFTTVLGSYFVWFMFLLIYKNYTSFVMRYNLILIYIPLLIFAGLYFKKLWIKVISIILLLLYLFFPYSPGRYSPSIGYFTLFFREFTHGIVTFSFLNLISGMPLFILLIYLLYDIYKKGYLSNKFCKYMSILLAGFALLKDTHLLSKTLTGTLMLRDFIEAIILIGAFLLIFKIIKGKSISRFFKINKFKLIVAGIVFLLFPVRYGLNWIPFALISSLYSGFTDLIHRDLQYGSTLLGSPIPLITDILFAITVPYIIACFVYYIKNVKRRV